MHAESPADARPPATARGGRVRRRLGTLAREPFLQFLALGLLVFLARGWFGGTPERYHVTIGPADVRRLATGYEWQFGRPPTAAELDHLIDRHIEEGRTVYVHCFGGVGRTGTIVGCWFVRHGRSGDEALERLAELWRDCPKSSRHPRSPQMPEQLDYVRNWREAAS